ncbi:MAG TPA: tetratricopeptide repeat protein [Candidatus Acidoferrales bacterium]
MRVKLQEQPFRLLCLLLENQGGIVSRENVRERLWPANTFVEFDASLSVAVGKLRDALTDDAENPRFIETVPRRGYRFIAPVETINPPAPPLSASSDAAPQILFQSPPVAAAASPGSKSNLKTIAAVLLFLAAATAFAFYKIPRLRRASAPSQTTSPTNLAPVPLRRSVAVLGFRNLPGRPEEDWLSTAFTEMLNTELAAGGTLRMVSGEDVARASRELPLTGEDTLAKPTLAKLRTNPGADIVILGSYTTLPGKSPHRIRLDLRAQDTAAGETIAEESVSGSEENLFELASQAGARLRQTLGVTSATPEITTEARAALPANQQALQFYSEGRAKLWQFDYLGARTDLEKAVAADPNYPLAHSALSEALWHGGYLVKSRAEAQRAVELSAHLPEEDRLLVQGQYERTVGDHPKMVDAYRSLYQMFPDRLDYGLLLAGAQSHLSVDDAARTLAELRRLPPPYGDDPRIDLTESTVWIDHDFNKSDAAAHRALDKGNAAGSPTVVGWAYGLLCQLSAVTSKSTADSIAVCERALQSSRSVKDLNGEAMMLTNLGGIRFQQGEITEAESLFTQALRQFRQIGNLAGVATTLSNLGAANTVQGNIAEARKLLLQCIVAHQTVGDSVGVAVGLNNLGDLSRQAGQLAVAESYYRQAKTEAAKTGDKDALAYIASGLGDVLSDRGDLPAARKSYEEALALRNQSAETALALETRVSLAQLAIEEGHPADAETAARACQKQFHDLQQPDDEMAASLVVINALLAQGQDADAKNELAAAQPLAAKNQNALPRLQFDLASAQIQLASDHPDAARPQLEKTLQAARQHGFLGLEFQTRLALAQLDKKSGRNAAAESQFANLEASATSKGFGHIARQASAAATANPPTTANAASRL